MRAPVRPALPALALTALGAMAAAARPATAQQVRGVVRAGSSAGAPVAGAPVAGATVILVDSAGARRAAALTDDAGRFTLRAPAAGRWALRVRRIGFRPLDAAPEPLAAGQVVTRALALAPQAGGLAGVRIETPPSCPRGDAAVRDAARYWSATRGLLEAAAAAEEAGLVRVEATRWTYDVDAEGVGLRALESPHEGRVARPFAAADPARLATFGFSSADADSTTYHAPDAAVLVSDPFAAAHCVRLVAADAAHPGAVGLAFEPARARGVLQVRGTLWVDSATAAPRAFAFGYVWPRGLVRPEVAARYGGEIVFATLPSGAVLVRRWALRVPLPVADHPGATARWGVRTVGAELRAVRADPSPGSGQALGALLGAWDAEGRERPPIPGTLAGVVYDSLRGVPVSGAQVLVSPAVDPAPEAGDSAAGPSIGRAAGAAGAALHVATTDAEGRWRLDTLPAGRWVVAIASEQLDAAGIAVPDARATLLGGDSAHVATYVPAAPTLLASLCPAAPDAAPDPDAGVVLGTVRGAAGAGATAVEFSWGGRRGVRGAVTAPIDSAGAYRACGVPRLLPVRVRLLAEGRDGGLGESALAGPREAVTAREYVVRVADGGATLVERGASAAPALAAVRVTARAAEPPSHRGLTGGRRGAMVFDRATIAQRNPARASDLLRGHGFLVVAEDGTVTTRDRITGDPAPGTACPLHVFVDGRAYGTNVDDISPAIIARMEVFTSAAGLPAELTGLRSGCGVIAVWTEASRAPRR